MVGTKANYYSTGMKLSDVSPSLAFELVKAYVGAMPTPLLDFVQFSKFPANDGIFLWFNKYHIVSIC